MPRILCLFLSILAILWGEACTSVSSRPRAQGKVGRFELFKQGVARVHFSGHSVESGWYFRVSHRGIQSAESSRGRVSIRVVNEGSAVWVDYLSGSMLLNRGDSVNVYTGVWGGLESQSDPADWQWVVFKRDNPSVGFVNLLVFVERVDPDAYIEEPMTLHAWYTEVLPGG